MAACRGLEQAALVFFPPTRDTFLTSNAPPPPAAPVPAADDGREEKEEEGEGEALKAHFTTLTDNLSQKIVGEALVSPQSGPPSCLGCRSLPGLAQTTGRSRRFMHSESVAASSTMPQGL